MYNFNKSIRKVDKATAKKLGYTYYWPDTLCSKGHLGFRYVSNGSCSSCEKERRNVNLSRDGQGRRNHEALAEDLKMERLLSKTEDYDF